MAYPFFAGVGVRLYMLLCVCVCILYIKSIYIDG